MRRNCCLWKDASLAPKMGACHSEPSIFRAIRAGNLPRVQRMLLRHPEYLKQTLSDTEPENVLCYAIRHEQPEIACYLLAQNSHEHLVKSKQHEALLLAVLKQQHQVIEGLLPHISELQEGSVPCPLQAALILEDLPTARSLIRRGWIFPTNHKFPKVDIAFFDYEGRFRPVFWRGIPPLLGYLIRYRPDLVGKKDPFSLRRLWKTFHAQYDRSYLEVVLWWCEEIKKILENFIPLPELRKIVIGYVV